MYNYDKIGQGSSEMLAIKLTRVWSIQCVIKKFGQDFWPCGGIFPYSLYVRDIHWYRTWHFKVAKNESWKLVSKITDKIWKPWKFGAIWHSNFICSETSWPRSTDDIGAELVPNTTNAHSTPYNTRYHIHDASHDSFYRIQKFRVGWNVVDRGAYRLIRDLAQLSLISTCRKIR